MVFESNPEEAETLDEQILDLKLENQNLGDNDAPLTALRYLLTEGKRWKIDWGNGVRGPFPLNPFTRLKLQRKQKHGDFWESRLSQRYYYFQDDGFGHKTKFRIGRPVAASYFIHNITQAQWKDEDNRWEFANTVSAIHVLNKRAAIDYNLGWIGENKPVIRTALWYLSTTYRYMAYKDWLFFEATPNLSFLKDDNFKLKPAITFKLELLFTDKQRYYKNKEK